MHLDAQALLLLLSTVMRPKPLEAHERKRKTTEAVRTLPASIMEEDSFSRRYIGSKSCESLSPKGKREASVSLVGFWQHATPGHQKLIECFCSQWHVWLKYVFAHIAQSGHGAFVQA
eukprot:1142424-Pelagomonas_calceolata.AAC.2